jgi:hypothetical protein
MPNQRIICQCEIYQTCEVCRDQTERDLAILRKRQGIERTTKVDLHGHDESDHRLSGPTLTRDHPGYDG